jgi:MFS family permease
MVYAFYNLFYSLLSYPAGALSDRIGRWRIIIVGWLIYACVYAGLALLPVSQAWGVWPLMAIYGVYMALTEGVGKALIADQVPSDCRGSAMGIFYGLTGLTTLIASLCAGILWDNFGAPAALLLGSSFAILAIIVLVLAGILAAPFRQPR